MRAAALSPPSARIQSLVQPNLRDGGGRNLQGCWVQSILALGLCGVMSAEGAAQCEPCALGWTQEPVASPFCSAGTILTGAGHLSLPAPAAFAASLILRKSDWSILPKNLPNKFRPIWFSCLAGKRLGTPVVVDVRLYGVVHPGRTIKGPFPNPGCPRVPNDRRRAVLPKRNFFLLGCLAQGTILRGWIRGRRSLLPSVMFFK